MNFFILKIANQYCIFMLRDEKRNFSKFRDKTNFLKFKDENRISCKSLETKTIIYLKKKRVSLKFK